MPVVDLRQVGAGSVAALERCDVCVVGTGPAGAVIARELAGSGLRVTVLESGDEVRRPETDLLNDIENVGRPRVPDQWSVRNRVLGGSSHTWGGRCAPFDEIDYEERSWVPASGWPFGSDELEPFLRRSAPYLGLTVGTGFSDDRFWALAGRERPAASPNPASLLPFFWQFSRDEEEAYAYEYTRFGRGLARRLGPDVTLVTSATVVRVDPDEGGRSVRSVEVAGPDGHRRTLRASAVVLAAGGLENARLLLVSDSVVPSGLGNDHDLVGRYLMDHPRGPVGSFDLAGSGALQKRLGRYNVRGRMFRAGFRLSPALQREEGLLNCAAWTGEVWSSDDPWAAMRRFSSRPSVGDALAVARNADLVVRGARDYFIERNGVPRKLDALELLAMVEQRPDPDSRLTLSDRRDRFGVPLPKLDWRMHPDEARTMRAMARVLVEELPRTGLPAPVLAEWVRDGGEVPAGFVDVAHPTGTTRMSHDPARGVVDADGQVHGLAGLYVTGTSVFPTAGHCNPTQMIVAMALRLADHLRDTTVARPVEPTAVPAVGAAAPATVLVTGATGRIGRVVVADLLERGYLVRATTSKEPPAARAGSVGGRGRVDWRRVDLEHAGDAEHDALASGCDAVVHLAAEIGAQSRMSALNAGATRALAAAAERAGVRSFVYTSSVSVYGSGRRRTATEDAPVLTPDRDERSEYWAMDYVRAYGRTKLQGELAIHETARTARYTVVRPTVVVDVDQVLEAGEWSTSKRWLGAHRHAHHVYVGDVSDALVWAVERGLSGVGAPGRVETFNVSEDEMQDPTHSAFFKAAHRATGDPRFRVLPVPGVADWLNDAVRFRVTSVRNPLWRMRFPADKIHKAGWTPRFGMAYARRAALDALRVQSSVPDADPEAEPTTTSV